MSGISSAKTLWFDDDDFNENFRGFDVEMEDESAAPVQVWQLNLFEGVREDDHQDSLRDEWFSSNTPQKLF